MLFSTCLHDKRYKRLLDLTSNEVYESISTCKMPHFYEYIGSPNVNGIVFFIELYVLNSENGTGIVSEIISKVIAHQQETIKINPENSKFLL